MASITQNFNALKRKNPKMTDSDAMKQAMNLTAESRKRIRKIDKKAAKKLNWAQKLKMGGTKQMANKAHSPAGKKHLLKKKAGMK